MQYLIYIGYAVFLMAALLMIGAILLQEGKGGGLSALGGTQAESAFGASNPVRRMTVVLAIVFFVLAGFLSYFSPRSGVTFPEKEATADEEEAGEEKAGEDASPAKEPSAAKKETRPPGKEAAGAAPQAEPVKKDNAGE